MVIPVTEPPVKTAVAVAVVVGFPLKKINVGATVKLVGVTFIATLLTLPLLVVNVDSKAVLNLFDVSVN